MLMSRQALMVPSLGIGGPELQRDVAYAAYMASHFNKETAADIFRSMIRVGKEMKDRFISVMLDRMCFLRCKTIAAMGFSYKRDR